jgi:hypothetical protein
MLDHNPNFRATFFNGKSYVLILIKIAWGLIMGDFFSNASGRPVFFV